MKYANTLRCWNREDSQDGHFTSLTMALNLRCPVKAVRGKATMWRIAPHVHRLLVSFSLVTANSRDIPSSDFSPCPWLWLETARVNSAALTITSPSDAFAWKYMDACG